MRFGWYFKQGMRHLLVFALCAALLLPIMTNSVGAAAKQNTSRGIAIVFDNSGSMYGKSNMRWSQATYAIEVFASMMNEGDVLQVYPMNPIEASGKEYTMESPLELRGGGDPSIIRSIYSPLPGDTHIETVTNAYEGVMRLNVDERWLVVLTDGANFYENGVEFDIKKTYEVLTERLSGYNESVNVIYLGIGDVTPPQISGSRPHASDKAVSKEVPAALSRMCNLIFGRDALPDGHRSGNDIHFDIPMSKLIVFAQGQDVSSLKIVRSDGTEISKPLSTYSPHYSENGAGGYYAGSPTDPSLQGMIVTYADCPAGDYRFICDGELRDIVVYYEPDVNMELHLVDEEGHTLSVGDEFYPGTYQITYGMVDNSGNTVESDLLGRTNYEIEYEINGEKKNISTDHAGQEEIQVGVGDVIKVVSASVTYLSGYRIDKGPLELNWPELGFTISAHPIGDLSVTVSGGAQHYLLSELESNGLYRLDVSYNGEKLTGAELDRLSWEQETEGGNAGAEIGRDEDGYYLQLRYGGSAAATDCGEYTVHLSALYLNEDDQSVPSRQQDISFLLEDDNNQLKLELERPQSFYMLSKISSGKPLIAHLTMDGQPLSEEQLAALRFTAKADGLPLLTERVPGESAFLIRIDPDGKIPTGTFRITADAVGQDSIGRELTASDSVGIEIQLYARWMRILAISLTSFLLILLIWLFLNAKVLPKKIATGKAMFTVDGASVPGSASYTYTGGGKKKGTLDVQLPKYSSNPMVRGGFHLDLEANSPRRIKSSYRTVRVTGMSPINGNSVQSVKVGSTSFVRNEETGKLERSGRSAKGPSDFVISGSSKCNIVGEAMDFDGGSTSFSLSVPLKFY